MISPGEKWSVEHARGGVVSLTRAWINGQGALGPSPLRASADGARVASTTVQAPRRRQGEGARVASSLPAPATYTTLLGHAMGTGGEASRLAIIEN